MNCHECEERLQRRLDTARRGVRSSEPRGSDPDLERHLAECQACRQTHAAAGVLLEGLESLPAVAPPLDFAWQTTAAVLRDRMRRRQKMRRRVLLTTVLAASILLMAWASNIWRPERRQKQDVPRDDIANHGHVSPIGPRPHDNAPKDHDPPQADEPIRVAEIRLAMASLTDRLAEQTRDQARVLIAVAPHEVPDLEAKVRSLAARPLEEPLDPAAQSLRQAGHEVSQGLEPVVDHACRAFGYFVKELEPR